ncbi:MAG TPA: type II toxin-antitoxin system RelE/ParE family toxin [Anaerolineae bacterium]|nr:type II toxin-antitoxin system RelE/ParE family toxin [Anaerolineae bacterium]
MATYEVKFATSAAKEFRSLSTELKHRIGAAIDGLSQDPRPPGVRKLMGHQRLYRIRVGQYRVVYEIDDKEQLIRITRLRHRREVYR